MSMSDKCIDLQAILYGTLGTAFTLDLIILILPLHLIWSLSMPTRKMFEVMAILGLGGIYVLFHIPFVVLNDAYCSYP